jgi:hypothetical protein
MKNQERHHKYFIAFIFQKITNLSCYISFFLEHTGELRIISLIEEDAISVINNAMACSITWIHGMYRMQGAASL